MSPAVIDCRWPVGHPPSSSGEPVKQGAHLQVEDVLENRPKGKGSDVPGGRLHALLRPSCQCAGQTIAVLRAQ